MLSRITPFPSRGRAVHSQQHETIPYEAPCELGKPRGQKECWVWQHRQQDMQCLHIVASHLDAPVTAVPGEGPVSRHRWM